MGQIKLPRYIPIKYPESFMKSDNQWNHIIANEIAETNYLLNHLIDLYIEKNKIEVKQPTAHEKSGAL